MNILVYFKQLYLHIFVIASRNDQHSLSVMLTEAEGNVQLSTGSPGERNVTNEAIKKLLTIREPCSGNTALHWAAKHGVFKYSKFY